MSLISAIAIYFIIWWLTLFVVLPIGVRSQAEQEDIVPGTDPGAPANPRLAMRMIANTILATLVFALFYAATVYLEFGLDDLADFIVPK